MNGDSRRLPSLLELRRLLADEFSGFGRRAVGIGLVGGLVAFIEIVIVLAIANLGSVLLSQRADYSIGFAFGLSFSRTQLGVIAVVAVVARGLIEGIYLLLQTAALTRYEIHARESVMKAFIDAEWIEQSQHPPAHFVNTTYSFLGSSRTVYRRVMEAVTALVSFLLMIAGSFVAGGFWAFGILAGAGAIALGLRPIAARAHGAGRSARDAAHRFGDAMWETVLLARETRVLGLDSIANERNKAAAAHVASANRSQALLAGLASSAYTSALYLVVTLGLLLISLIGVGNPARIVAILLLLYRGLGYGKTFQSTYQEIVNSEPAIQYLKQTRDRLHAARLPQGGAVLNGPLREVLFRDVEFRYGEGVPALRGLNLRIAQGDTLGVVGPSGAGKSTFVNLMLRLITPTGGAVLVNDEDLSTLELASWFGRAVLVPQDARTYEGSVLDNVTCHRATVSHAEARDALRSAHLLDEMEALPGGLDTPLSANRLSGGQRQRLAIARALAGQPEILVLDEPTSALDPISEEAIRQALEELRGRVTLVIVAHRLSTLRICERVLVLDHGQVEAVGLREDLEKGSVFYAEALRLARLV